MRKKKRYFTHRSLARQARRMSVRIRRLKQEHPVQLLPEKSALLILDMQRYFLDSASHAYIPSAPAIIPGLLQLCELYRSRNLPIILTRHVNSPEDAKALGRWWRDLLQAQDPLSEIIPELLKYDALVIEKSQYDAFYHTDLEDRLKARDVQQLVIGGVMTHLCCETTARAAFVRGLDIFFTVDGTATYTKNFHRATLLNLAHGVATPATISEILSLFDYDECE
jgi:isochorismate hydrolase